MPTRHKAPRRAVLEQRAQQYRRITLLLFAASGIAGLIYEVVWSRQLTLVFGATTLAVSTVLTTFMFGLGLGSLLAGRGADRVVRHASAETWNALGVAYAQQGEYERAKGAWDQALRLDPEHAGTRRNRERVEQALTRSGAAGSALPFLD